MDNVVFKLGFAPSIPAARQLISHGHVLLDGKKASIASMVVTTGQEISIKDKAMKSQTVLQGLQSPRVKLPDFLKKEDKKGRLVGILQSPPELKHVPFSFDSGLFTEYYAARKA